MTCDTWHTLAFASLQLLLTPLVTTLFTSVFLTPEGEMRRIYPSLVTWAVCDLSRESLMYSWSGDCRSPPPGLPGNTHPGSDWPRRGHVTKILASYWIMRTDTDHPTPDGEDESCSSWRILNVTFARWLSNDTGQASCDETLILLRLSLKTL